MPASRGRRDARHERAGYLNGLYRNSLRIQDLKQKIADEKALQAAEDATEDAHLYDVNKAGNRIDYP